MHGHIQLPQKTMMISIMSYGVFSYVAPYRDRKPKNRNTTIDSSISEGKT